MDNPETQATLGTQDTGRRQTKQQQKHNAENDFFKHGSHRQTGGKSYTLVG